MKIYLCKEFNSDADACAAISDTFSGTDNSVVPVELGITGFELPKWDFHRSSCAYGQVVLAMLEGLLFGVDSWRAPQLRLLHEATVQVGACGLRVAREQPAPRETGGSGLPERIKSLRAAGVALAFLRVIRDHPAPLPVVLLINIPHNLRHKRIELAAPAYRAASGPVNCVLRQDSTIVAEGAIAITALAVSPAHGAATLNWLQPLLGRVSELVTGTQECCAACSQSDRPSTGASEQLTFYRSDNDE